MAEQAGYRRVFRYPNEDAMLRASAGRLLDEMRRIQQTAGCVQLAVGGGSTMTRFFQAMTNLYDDHPLLDPAQVELWWVSERYVASGDPSRNSTQALMQLAKSLEIVPSQIHAMPMTSTLADAHKAAQQYADELADTVFDIAVLSLGADGEIAAIYPAHHSLTSALETTTTVIGVSDPPHGRGERISLTLPALNRSKQVWVLASGPQKATVARASLAGDPHFPASHLAAQHRTFWFMDEAAALGLPYYQCEL